MEARHGNRIGFALIALCLVASQHTIARSWAPAAAVEIGVNCAPGCALSQGDIKDKFSSAGVETVGGSPEQLAATMKSEAARIAKL